MAWPAVVAAGIAATAQTGQMVATGKMNKKSRFHSLRMYERQTSDERANWHMQNEYNSPAAQMQRFRDAGLNPNLVYGNGATTTADSIHTGQMSNPQQQTPDVAGYGRIAMDGLAAYNDLRMSNAQISNMEKQGAILDADEQIKEEQLRGLEFENDMNDNLRGYTLEGAEYDTRIKQDRMNIQRAKELRDIDAHTKSIEESVERMALSKMNRDRDPLIRDEIISRIASARSQQMINAFEIELNRKGLTKSDPKYLRMLSQFWDNYSNEILGNLNIKR